MKNVIVLLVVLFIGQTSYAHNYYFAFAELEYNELDLTLEATIIASAHDIESIYIANGIISKSLENAKKNKKEYYAINDDLNKHFLLSDLRYNSKISPESTTQIEFILEGFEVLLNGNVQFYLSAKLKEPLLNFNVTFDLLMERFPDQQNKLTIRFRDKKMTYNYLITSKINEIKLEE